MMGPPAPRRVASAHAEVVDKPDVILAIAALAWVVACASCLIRLPKLLAVT